MPNEIVRCPHWWRIFERRLKKYVRQGALGGHRVYYRFLCRKCMDK